MGLHSPLPRSLKAECDKCAKILQAFTMPSADRGVDKIIPKNILMSAKGLAIITVVRVGFLVGLRGGSGLVVARTDSGWSAPSAVALGGLGGGLEIGGEITDFILVLNSRRAVESFYKGGNVTLGGNLACAAGPYGRSAEGDVAVRNAAAFFTYSRSRGLYAGLSLEGTYISERRGANEKLYGANVRARELLQGRFEQPAEATNLYRALDGMAGGAAVGRAHQAANMYSNATRPGASQKPAVARPGKRGMSFSMPGLGSKSKSSPSTSSQTKSARSTSSNSSWSTSKPSRSSAAPRPTPRPSAYNAPKASPRGSSGGGYRGVSSSGSGLGALPGTTASTRLRLKSVTGPKTSLRGTALSLDTEPTGLAAMKAAKAEAEARRAADEWEQDVTCKAMHDYNGEMDCDLTFKKGDVITVLTRTDSQDDWWEGRLKNRVGIFPANYCKL